jgi:hypothetical protein
MWYYIKNNQSIGPVSIDELLNEIDNNTLIFDDEGTDSEWKNADSFTLIKNTLSQKIKINNSDNFVNNKKFNHYNYVYILLSFLLCFFVLTLILEYQNILFFINPFFSKDVSLNSHIIYQFKENFFSYLKLYPGIKFLLTFPTNTTPYIEIYYIMGTLKLIGISSIIFFWIRNYKRLKIKSNLKQINSNNLENQNSNNSTAQNSINIQIPDSDNIASRRPVIPVSFAIAIIFFFFTFCELKCGTQKIGSITGIELIKASSKIKDLGNLETEIHGKLETETILLIVFLTNFAFGAAIIGLGAFLIKVKKENILGTFAGLIGAVSLIILQLVLKSEIDEIGKGFIETNFQFPYWGALIAFGIGGSISYLRIRKKNNLVIFLPPTPEKSSAI